MKFLKAALMSIIIAISGVGLFTLSIEDATAATRTECHTYWSHGVKHHSCHKVHQYRTECHTYWSHGVKHHSCHKVRRY